MRHSVRAEPWGCGSSGAVDEGAAAGHRLALMIGSGAIGTAACVSIERCGAAAGQRWHALGRPPRADSAVPAADECAGVAVRPLLAQGRQQALPLSPYCRWGPCGSRFRCCRSREPPPPIRAQRACACVRSLRLRLRASSAATATEELQWFAVQRLRCGSGMARCRRRRRCSRTPTSCRARARRSRALLCRRRCDPPHRRDVGALATTPTTRVRRLCAASLPRGRCVTRCVAR